MARPDWKALEAFVRVAELGSLTAAAKALALSQPTASRYVAALEEELGAKLFVRHSRGLALSDRGAELFKQAKLLDDGVQSLFRSAAGLRQAPAGTVRVSVNEPLGVYVLPPCIARLRREHPAIALELVIDNAVANLSRREADIAVRMFRPEQLELVAHKLGVLELGLFATRSYLKRHGVPTSMSDARKHTLIGSDRDLAWQRGIAALGLSPTDFALRTDSLVAQTEATLAGVGIGGMQVAIARRHPALLRVLPDLPLPALEVWLVMHNDLRGDPATRVVFDALSRALAEHVQPSASPHGRRVSR